MAFEATELEHENPRVRSRRVLALVGGFLVCVAVLMIGLSFFYRHIVKDDQITENVRSFPGPKLQPNPSQDYANFRSVQDGELKGYSWVDQDKALIHVPIERAMDYVAARGALAFDPLEPNPGQTPPPTPSDGQSRATTFPQVAPYGVHP